MKSSLLGWLLGTIVTDMNITAHRLHNQGLLENRFSSADEIVRWFGAVQAQEYLPSMWAIGLRLPGATEKDVQQAILDRKILRTWPMRGTIHYLPAEDTKWMTALLAKRVNVKFQSFLNKINLTTDTLLKARSVLIRSLEGGKQCIRKELYAELFRAGIDAKAHGLHIMGYWAQEGLICFGPYRDKQPTFVLLDEWAPAQRLLEGEDALAEITKRYFVSHGPATVQDFAWWSGLTMAEAKQGLALVKNEFVHEVENGKEYWFTPYKNEPITNSNALLLPCFDEYTVAYKDRSAAISDDLLKEVGYAVNNNNVIIDGRIVGTWKRTLTKNEVSILVSGIRTSTFTSFEKDTINRAAERYGIFVERSVKVSY